MLTDIVERLRKPMYDPNPMTRTSIYSLQSADAERDEAADEIERLALERDAAIARAEKVEAILRRIVKAFEGPGTKWVIEWSELFDAIDAAKGVLDA